MARHSLDFLRDVGLISGCGIWERALCLVLGA